MAWGALLSDYWKEEALDTLREEGLLAEYFYVFKIDKNWYTLGGDIPLTEPSNEPSEQMVLNIEHRKMKKECLEPVDDATIAYMLCRLD